MDLNDRAVDVGAAPASADAALDPARYAIAGVAPRAVARPADREALCEALRAAARDRMAVVPWGGGTALPLEAAPERYDLAIDLRGLDRLVEYEPEDLTLTAECGIALAALRDRLAARGQELPLEGAHADRATLGGVLAANASGPRRMRFGSPRDRILGARYALGDGTLVRTGGRVVKNVAGYGIHRMLCGSRGGLAILVDASLKLMPAPAARRALVYGMEAADLAHGERWAPFPRLEPAFLTVASAAIAGSLPAAPGAFRVVVGLEDDGPRVDQLEALVVERLGPPSARIDGGDVQALAQRLADLEDAAPARLSFTAPHLAPPALAPVLAAAPESFVCHAACGRLHLFADPSRAAERVEALAALGWTLIGARGAGAVEPATPPVVRALRRRVRDALDPDRVMALGGNWVRSTG